MAIEYLYWGVATYLGYLEDEGILKSSLKLYKNRIINFQMYVMKPASNGKFVAGKSWAEKTQLFMLSWQTQNSNYLRKSQITIIVPEDIKKVFLRSYWLVSFIITFTLWYFWIKHMTESVLTTFEKLRIKVYWLKSTVLLLIFTDQFCKPFESFVHIFFWCKRKCCSTIWWR